MNTEREGRWCNEVNPNTLKWKSKRIKMDSVSQNQLTDIWRRVFFLLPSLTISQTPQRRLPAEVVRKR
ncbi:hypothetical protein LSH36_1157g00002 [Paralvinella palmiformis]|uniref:Uncharacterized protein n=1 Tax=Paralvinella palmiformis TaxID=53620 RepID=A0AAD9IUA5_9ANNE|nr:hypothetical protein LSH36_1157g00002 [Paralvinella palmiformis]